MKKITLIATSIAMASTLYASVKGEPVSVEEFKGNKALMVFGITPTKAAKVGDNLYMMEGTAVRQGRAVPTSFYMTGDKKMVLLGGRNGEVSAYDTNGDEPYIPQDMMQYKKDAAFKIGSGSKDYFVWTDPDCPFCREFKKMILEHEKMLENATFHFFLMPLTQLHALAEAMSLDILNQKSDGAKWARLQEINKMSPGEAAYFYGTESQIERVCRERQVKNVEAEKKIFKDLEKKKAPKFSVSFGDIEKLRGDLKGNLDVADKVGARGAPAVFAADGEPIKRWTSLPKEIGGAKDSYVMTWRRASVKLNK